MRTVKHKLILNLEQESKLLEIMEAYQNEKNFFSEKLLCSIAIVGIQVKAF